MPSAPRNTTAPSTFSLKSHHKFEGQASPIRRPFSFFFAMRGIRIVQIFFCTVASKRATFAPKRGIGEGGFFPPQRNRMGTNHGNRRSSGSGAAVPIAVFPKNRGLVPMSVPILFPLCSHPCSHQRKMAGAKKRITKPFFRLRTSSWEQSILSINKKRI